MNLEDQVCSLPLAKRLKELGVKQESYFFWVQREIANGYRLIIGEHYICPCESDDGYHSGCSLFEIAAETEGGPGKYDPEQACSAFTVAELGELLPRYIEIGVYACELQINRSSVWRFYYGNPQYKGSVVFTAGTDDTEADARAKMLIYLIQSKFVAV